MILWTAHEPFVDGTTTARASSTAVHGRAAVVPKGRVAGKPALIRNDLSCPHHPQPL